MSTAPMPLVQVFDPQGNLGDIPYDKLQDAVKAGAKPAVKIQAPDGSIGYVPAGREVEAQRAGGKIIPYDVHEDGDGENRGFWHELGQGLKGVAGGMIHMPLSPSEALSGVAAAPQLSQNLVSRLADQRSPLYTAGATTAETALGVPAGQMEAAARRGDIGGVAGAATAPLVPLAAGTVAGAVTSRLARGGLPERMYESALKPSTTLGPQLTEQVLGTGLSQDLPVTKAGYEKLGGLLEDLQDNVRKVIATNPNAPISTTAIAGRTAGTLRRFATQVNPEADIATILGSREEFLRNFPGQITAEEAQALKQGTYQALGSKAYGELKGAAIEAQKALARGAREELEGVFPEIGTLNAAEKRLYNLEPELARAIGRVSNRDLLGIGTPIAAGAGEMVTGSPKIGAAVGIMKAIFDNPGIKSRVAIMLSRAGGITPAAAAQRVAAYGAALDAAAAPRGNQGNEQ